MRVAQALKLGIRRLPRRAGLPDPHREALWLLAHAWGRDESWVRLNWREEVPPAVRERYSDWVARRAAGVPAHHLTGACPFWGRDFLVSAAVLVPRPETELIIAAALDLALPERASVVDVGTGTGCIAITLAVERPAWRVVAVDLSLGALAVARGNLRRHRAHLVLAASDLGSAVDGPFDLIVANLPYIETAALDGLSTEVRHDPRLALDGGVDGLDLVRKLLADAPRLLAVDGWLVLELGEDQAEAVAGLARRSGLEELRRVGDLAGCERILVLRRTC